MTINPATGAATLIGDTGDRFAGLALVETGAQAVPGIPTLSDIGIFTMIAALAAIAVTRLR